MEKLELSLGFSMALAQNDPAMKRFESMTEAQKQAVIERAQRLLQKRDAAVGCRALREWYAGVAPAYYSFSHTVKAKMSCGCNR